jgi:hypothetical protein
MWNAGRGLAYGGIAVFFFPHLPQPSDILLGYRYPAARGPLICVAVWALSLLYYAYSFDSAGRVNPDWTGIFG